LTICKNLKNTTFLWLLYLTCDLQKSACLLHSCCQIIIISALSAILSSIFKSLRTHFFNFLMHDSQKFGILQKSAVEPNFPYPYNKLSFKKIL